MIPRSRDEKERLLREAAETLLSALDDIERVGRRLAEAEEEALHQRARTLISSGARLQEDVAFALGDAIRSRVVEELCRRPPKPLRTLSVV
ncbi:MAG: hypothetical protein ACE5JR_13495 [Gemmatimonadota bacterium]